jgi:arachidonate 15-lipoxygenase
MLWGARRAFWNRLAITKFRANKPASIPVPTDGPRINAVSFAREFPKIPIPNIRVADRVPDDEASRLKYLAYQVQVALYSLFSPMQEDLPSIDADPQRALDEAYTSGHRECFPPPTLPDEYRGPIDLGRLAVASPYACYVERSADGGYQWDFRSLGRFEHHPGLRSLALRVAFDVDTARRRLVAVQIDSELGASKPGDPQWDLSTRMALCAATTHVSLVRHFNGVHLAAGGPLAIATRNALPARHPLRRLLFPHIFGTQYSNQIVTKGQMAVGGDFETTFSFTHRGMCELFGRTYEEYDVTVLDPAADARARGIAGQGFDTPALDNRQAHWDVFHVHADRYLRIYYASDGELAADAAVRAWVQELDRLVPNGVRKIAGAEPTIAGVAGLIASFIYMAAVEHEILGTGLWNYQMWTHVQPARVYRDGRREPLDVYQRLVNANFNLNVHRAQLAQDFSYLALDPRGAQAFRQFLDDLRALDARVAAEPPAPWKMRPAILEANINA